MARRTFTQAALGVALWMLGAALLLAVPHAARALEPPGEAPPLLEPAPAASASPAAPAAPATPPPAPPRTPREDQPPPRIGEAFDRDDALPRDARIVASYRLEAKLDAEAHRIHGKGTLIWRNASSRPTDELYFHLYLNAFKNNRSAFLRSPFGAGRSGRTARTWGYMDVSRLAVREMDGVDVWPPAGKRHGDDPDDETDVRVPLPRPVAPGETLHLDVEWTSQLPEIVERTGYSRDFHMVAQWFPKIARREADGTWAHFPFNAKGEFYADFGEYDVTLDVPEGVVVGATGALEEAQTSGGRTRVRHVARDVHDFAWTAWKGFRERGETVDGVRVRVLFPPGNDRNAEAALRAVRHGLAFLGRAYGRYPYRDLTVVHPPAHAPAAGGMEYPTLITTGGPWYTAYGSSVVERVTLHELAHQWFYGLVATNEQAFPFLDEGLATYAEARAMHALEGVGDGASLGGFEIAGHAYLRAVGVEAGHDDVIGRPAADFVSFGKMGALVYARTGTLLETLARVYGDGVDRALGRYARRYRFEHPGPKHLVAAFREVVGDDAADALSAALFEGGWVDFAVGEIDRGTRRLPAGVFDDERGRKTEEPPRGEDAEHPGRVVVYRRGTLRLPVNVDIHLEDGTRLRKRWDGRDRWHTLATEGSPPVAAVVDPDLHVLLDDDLTNNAGRRGPARVPRLVERGLYAAELLLGVVGP